MSVDLAVSFPASRLVSCTQWQHAIDSLGFPVRLGPFEWFSQAGVLPVRINGDDVGFELDLEDSEEFFSVASGPTPHDHDVIAMFHCGTDMKEFQASLCAAAALAHATGGMLHDPQNDLSHDAAAAVAEARGALDSE